MSARSVNWLLIFASLRQRNICVNQSSSLPHFFQRLIIAGILTSTFVSEVALADSPAVVHYSYDAGDNVATVTDPRGLITSYTYDGLGQRWSLSSPDTGTTTYAYDAYGRLASFTRSNGAQTTYGYDTVNRPISISASGQTQTFTYDSCTHGLGRLCSAGDTTGTTSYSYTPEGWIAGRGFSIAGTTYALGYSYDAMGHLVALSYPDGNQAVYNYVNGAVSGVTVTQAGSFVSVASNVTWQPAASVLASWNSSNGLVNTLSYDTDGRPTAINVPGVQGLSFVYDTADRIVGVSNAIDSTMSQNYGYDEQSRLVSVYSSQGMASYAYDVNGNRIATMENGAANTTSYSANSNQIVSVTGTNPLSYGYDALGNITTLNGVTTYQYDSFNRMAAAGGVSYYVSPEGQRLRKTGTTGTTYFATDVSGTPLAEYLNGTWVDYLWLGGRLIGREANGQLEAIHDDQTGRPQVVTNASGVVVWNARNGSFSRSVTLNSTQPLNIGFPGQYYDQETGLWNNGFRDYDPALGRYVESDPIGQEGGVNTYAYVGNNPLTGADPAGLATAVIVGNASGWNFAGHVAIAFTGQGVYSYGTGTAFGSSTTAYLTSQAAYRSSTVYVLDTTPAQEAAMIAYLNGHYSPQSGQHYSIFNHSCATAVNSALGSQGIGDDAIVGVAQAGGIMLSQLPSTAGFIGSTYPGASIISLPQGAVVPASLSSFNPAGP